MYLRAWDKIEKKEVAIEVTLSSVEGDEDFAVVEGEVNPFTAVVNTVRKDVMQRIRDFCELNDIEILEPERAYTNLMK